MEEAASILEYEGKAKGEAAREIERLQSDLTRYIDIATKEATEAEGLRQAVDAFADICDELGCERDNEAGLQAAADLKATVSTLTRQLEEARGDLETAWAALRAWVPGYLEGTTPPRSLKQGERE
jgi:multidrug resistance efflux pump